MMLSKKQFAATLLYLFFCQILLAQAPLQYIPGNVPIVMSFNLDQLNKKVSLDELKQYDFYQSILKEMHSEGESETEKAYMKKFLDTPSEVGYNMLQPFHFMMQKEGDITYYAILMKMGDQAKYELGMQGYKLENYKANLSDQGNYKYWSHNEETFAWNDDIIINVWAEKAYSYDNWSMEEEEAFNWEEDEAEEEIKYEDTEEPVREDEELNMPPTPLEEGEEYADIEEWDLGNENNWNPGEQKMMLAAFTKKIMNKESATFLSSNPKYQSSIASSRSDVHFWMDYSFFLEAMQDGNAAYGMIGSEAAMMMQSMQGMIDIFYSDTYLSMGMNFQDGKMAINSDLFVNEDVKRFYSRALDAKFNKKFLRYIDGGDHLFGYYYFNLNIRNSIEEGKTLMHKALNATPEFGQMADDAMKILGIFIDEEAIANLLKGDLLMAVSGMKMMEVTETIYDYDEDFNSIAKDTTLIKRLPIVTMLASYGNHKDIMKFVDLGIHSKVIKQEGNYFTMEIPEMGTNMYMALKNGVMIFTNDQNLVANKLDTGYKGKQRLSKKHRKLMCKNSGVFYWDIPNTLYAVASDTPSTGDPMTSYLETFAKQFESLELTSSKKVENSIKSQFDFNFTNKGTNSLEQFFNFVNDMYIEFIGGARI